MSGLINLLQTNDERRAKYWLAKSLGKTSKQARGMRDYRLTALEYRLGLEVTPRKTLEMVTTAEEERLFKIT